jgi:Ribbon-helix-helix protein, copG family
MRTTLTLDDDVAALLREAQDRRKTNLKSLVNEAIREYLTRRDRPPKTRKRYRIRPVSVGPSLVGNLDCVSEVLAIAEGEAYK